MAVWFTADLHLGHANIIRYCNRPFMNEQESTQTHIDSRGRWRISDATVRRHDAALLDAVNSRVKPEDELWILGDFCWGRLEVAKKYRERIQCRTVYLIWGNHDHETIQPCFTDCHDQRMIYVENQPIWLNHYPSRSWDRRFHGAWHLYGHVHGKFREEDERNPAMLTRDVGVDACDYRPWSFEELRSYMAPRTEEFLRQKEAFLNGANVDVG